MVTEMNTSIDEKQRIAMNGASVAAVLAAGIGAFAMGLLVIASEAGIFSAPAIYSPAGGLSGRSTFAVIIWLAAWLILHARWKNRNVEASGVFKWSLALVVMGIVMTFPPVWSLL
jgi:hypothetical protein